MIPQTPDRLIAFIKAREQMRLNKAKGITPVSDDPILAKHRFCNINREHDAVTRFIHENFRVPFHSRGLNFMVRQMMFCRIFNDPATLRQVCPLEDSATAIKVLDEYQKKGNKLMRGVYMMPPHPPVSRRGVDMITFWVQDVCDGLQQIDFTDMMYFKEIAEAMMGVCGIGPFLANQVCADLRYVPWGGEFDMALAELLFLDWRTFILCGPGTRRGINRFYGKDPMANGTDQQFTEMLLEIRDWACHYKRGLSSEVKLYFQDPNNLANTFCEFDKHERARAQLAEGKEVTLRHYKPSLQP